MVTAVRYFIYFALSFAWPAYALSPLFSSEAILDLTLRSPLKFEGVLERTRASFGKKSAVVSYFWEGRRLRAPVQVELRGASRLTGCEFPPFKLIVNKKVMNPLFWELGHSIKAVTQCSRGDQIDDRKLLFKEYMLYRIAESTGFPAFKTRLVRIRYERLDGSLLTHQYAFFIESRTHLAKRDSRIARVYSYSDYKELTGRQVYDSNYNVALNLTERLILNEDWQAYPSGPQNVDTGIFKNGTYFQVPYDFDISPLVSSSAQDIPQDNNDFLKYFCRRKGRNCKPAVTVLLRREAAVLAAINNSPGVSSYDKGLAMMHAHRFFEAMKNLKRANP